MDARALGVAALLAALGAGGGYLLADGLQDPPTTIDVAAPVPGESPSYPSDPEVEVLPDPGYPPLAPALPLHRERLGTAAFGVRVPVPDGWVRTDSDLVEAKWRPSLEVQNTYILRVKIVSGQRQTIEQALRERIEAVAADPLVEEFVLETETDDTFVASYVIGGYRRVAMERYLSLDGSEAAFATIVIVGRERDRGGMADLLARMTQGASRA